MTDPVFSAEDRVRQTQLPAELQGVTDPVKVAQYYQQREAQLREQLRTQTPPQPTRVTVTEPTQPTPSPVATFTAAEATGARETLIAAARSQARQGKKYWDRLSDKIEAFMRQAAPEDQVNSMVWETYYNTLVGMQLTTLLEGDRIAEAEANRLAAERSSAPPERAAAPAPLPVEVTGKVLPGLGINETQYREAQDRMMKGSWPLTADNTGGRRVRIGEQ